MVTGGCVAVSSGLARPLCPSDISPASGGNPAPRPPREPPATVASLARVPLASRRGRLGSFVGAGDSGFYDAFEFVGEF